MVQNGKEFIPSGANFLPPPFLSFFILFYFIFMIIFNYYYSYAFFPALFLSFYPFYH